MKRFVHTLRRAGISIVIGAGLVLVAVVAAVAAIFFGIRRAGRASRNAS